MQEELMSLFPPAPEVTRRTLVVASLTAGFALAVQPIQAQTTITTDTNGLIADEVKIPVKDGETPAYRASYRKEQATDGWNLLLAWFKKNGVA